MNKILNTLIFTILYMIRIIFYLKLNVILEYILFILMYRVVRYRKDIISKNIEIVESTNSNNTKNIEKGIEKYYKYLTRLILETLWCFTANPKEIYDKIVFENIEVFDDIYKENKNASIALSHIGNWELFCQWAGLYIPKLNIITLYTPIKNKYLNDILLELRQRTNVKLVSTKSTFELIKSQKKLTPCINLFAIDQNPGAPDEQVHLNFFNRNVPVITGLEKFANITNQDIYYLDIKYYNQKYHLKLVKVEKIENIDNPYTVSIFDLLTKNILNNPYIWLLSHNRFKHSK